MFHLQPICHQKACLLSDVEQTSCSCLRHSLGLGSAQKIKDALSLLQKSYGFKLIQPFCMLVCLLSWLPVLIMLMSSPHKYIVNRPKKHISCKTNFLCLPSAVITRLWLRWVATLYKLSVNLHKTLIILCYNPITGSLHIVPLSWIGCQRFPIPSSVFTFFSIIKSVTSPMLI